MIAELRNRDPLLFWTGALMMLGLLVVTLISIGDTRQILGLNPWIKPMKFMTSITIFLWTVAWFMPETTSRVESGFSRMDKRQVESGFSRIDKRQVVSGFSRIDKRQVVSGFSRIDKRQMVSGFSRIDKRQIVRWTIATAMMTEIVCITMQSVRGTTSHFNHETAFDDAVFSIMGMGVVFNTLAMLLFLLIIRRDTPPSRAGYLWGIRLGVALFLVASLQGTLIVGNDAHSVPGPDGGPGLPFVNWSTTQGDLRIAHFFSMHAMQALPLLGYLLDRASVRRSGSNAPLSLPARNVVIAVGILWLAATGGLLFMALNGRPLLAL